MCRNLLFSNNSNFFLKKRLFFCVAVFFRLFVCLFVNVFFFFNFILCVSHHINSQLSIDPNRICIGAVCVESCRLKNKSYFICIIAELTICKHIACKKKIDWLLNPNDGHFYTQMQSVAQIKGQTNPKQSKTAKPLKSVSKMKTAYNN